MASNNTPNNSNNGKTATPPEEKETDFTSLTTDEKLDLLLHSVTKMFSIPKDMLDINARITKLTTTVNDIPKLKAQVRHETLLKANEGTVNDNKTKIASIEKSIIFTQGIMDDMGKKLKGMEAKLASNNKVTLQILPWQTFCPKRPLKD